MHADSVSKSLRQIFFSREQPLLARGKILYFASDLMHNSTGYVIKQLVHAFSCALSSYGARGKFGEHERGAIVARGDFSCFPNFPRAP